MLRHNLFYTDGWCVLKIRVIGMPQVPLVHYNPTTYDNWPRWNSYWYQIQAVLRVKPQTLLEIGCGTGLTTWYLRNRVGIAVTTFDHDSALHPDVVGDVMALSTFFGPGSFECICAFQILEHIPYEFFEPVLRQMSQIATRRVIISLPYSGRPIHFHIQFLAYRWILLFSRNVGRPRPWNFDGSHYWELGTKGYSLAKVTKAIHQIFKIERQYFCPDNPYHYFFECVVQG